MSTTTSSTDHFKALKQIEENKLKEVEKEIETIQREADHKTWGLKYDAATLRKKIKALDKQIEETK